MPEEPNVPPPTKTDDTPVASPVILGASEQKVHRFYLWNRAFARNRWLVIVLPLLIIGGIGVAIYAFAATSPWQNTNQWSGWQYETNTTVPVTHANSTNLQLQFNTRQKGYTTASYATYRIDLPTNVAASSITYTAAYNAQNSSEVYLAADSPTSKLWSKTASSASSQTYTVKLNGQHTLWFGVALHNDTYPKKSRYLSVSSYTISGTITTPDDTTVPSAAISAPTAGSTLAGTASLAATASDNVAVAGVTFMDNGVAVAPEDTTAPYSVSWDTTKTTNGTHVLSAIARDTSGNKAASATVSVTINNQTVTTTTTPPPTTTTSKIYWGAFLDGNDTYDYYYGPTGFWKDAPWGNTGNTWDKFEANAGKKVSILHYGQPNPWKQTTFYGSTADIITQRGAIPMITMSSDDALLTDIAAGQYDASIKTWAANVKAWGKPLLLRWDWEMNGTWYSYGAQAKTNPASYVAMWRHVHDVVAAAGATNVSWIWCVNTEFTGSTDIAQLYPGDAYVDWTSMDGYNFGTNPAKPAGWKSFYQVYKPTYDHILQIAPTKPIILSEVASSEYGGSKASWITDALTTQLPTNFPKIKAMVWFNWRINESGVYWDWPIESSVTAQDAFAKGISSSYYTTNNYGSLPPLSKVPLP